MKKPKLKPCRRGKRRKKTKRVARSQAVTQMVDVHGRQTVEMPVVVVPPEAVPPLDISPPVKLELSMSED